MRHTPRAPGRLTPALVTATTVATVLLAPATTLLPGLADTAGRAWRRARDDEAGVSEIAVIALITGLAALLVVAYMAIVSGKVENEANNLPTSGG